MNVFTDALLTLAEFSAKVDCGFVSEDDFCTFQKLEQTILDAYTYGKIGHDAKRSLITLYQHILCGMRFLLGR